jgi:AraC-like DNA-binding protein
MPLILSEQNWEELWETDVSSRLETCHPDSFETKSIWYSALNQGWCRTIKLRDLWLVIEESHLKEDLIFHSETASWGPVSSFFVAGTLKNCHLGLTQENLEAPGGHYLECLQDTVEIDHWFAKEQVVRIRFGLAPEALAQFGVTNNLPRELYPLASGEVPDSFYRQGTTTAEMQVILHQILHCPYGGSIKQMYLEGKVLELAALQFSQFAQQDGAEPSSLALRPDDIERLHQARAILMQQTDQPPTLIALARQVGLNDCKLKQGFRQVFGTTVFGYLRDHRLEQARLLLTEGRLSVQQVAHTVGYAQSGYFARAFRRKFGINPKTFQLQITQPGTQHKKSE